MPRKTIRERQQKNPSQTKRNRIRENVDQLIGIEDPDLLMSRLLRILKETTSIPQEGEIYTFLYSPKTANLQYDAHPVVAVTNIFSWGFKGINFHWGKSRQYTWNEIITPLHRIYKEELADIRQLHLGKIQFNV
jgi:hypothetical protein